MHSDIRQPIDFAIKLTVKYLSFIYSTYMRVSNFGQIFNSKKSLRLIRGSTYTRVYTVITHEVFFWGGGPKVFFAGVFLGGLKYPVTPPT